MTTCQLGLAPRTGHSENINMHLIANPILVVSHPDNFVECFARKHQTATFELTPSEVAAGQVTVSVANFARIEGMLSTGTPAVERASEGALEAGLPLTFQEIYEPRNRLAAAVAGACTVIDACLTQWEVMEYRAISQAMRSYTEEKEEAT